mmetsp:Transcript_8495/g.35477  ORF Transcript_8495/g.35477 Transcript_8495/m.35477 type:complete len:214 (-) Transcript_8495:964-1605(-)
MRSTTRARRSRPFGRVSSLVSRLSSRLSFPPPPLPPASGREGGRSKNVVGLSPRARKKKPRPVRLRRLRSSRLSVFSAAQSSSFLVASSVRSSKTSHAAAGLIRILSSCACLGSFTLSASPKNFNTQTHIQVMSICHHSKPCLAENSNAWWLLCHPSPNARMPIHQLFRERSPVLYVWLPQTCATEFTAHVMWYTQHVRTQNPHTSQGKPPRA